MDKSTLKVAKGLRRRGVIYFEDSVNPDFELNYQYIIAIIESTQVSIDEETYKELKNDRNSLILELALSTFQENDLISDNDIEFSAGLIEKYYDMDSPVFIYDEYVFFVKTKEMEELYEMAMHQVHDGKFENLIFKECHI